MKNKKLVIIIAAVVVVLAVVLAVVLLGGNKTPEAPATQTYKFGMGSFTTITASDATSEKAGAGHRGRGSEGDRAAPAQPRLLRRRI